MPNPTITGSTYAGEFAGKYLGAALLSADTLDKGAITMPTVSTRAAQLAAAGKAQAAATDKVEWPVKVSGKTN